MNRLGHSPVIFEIEQDAVLPVAVTAGHIQHIPVETDRITFGRILKDDALEFGRMAIGACNSSGSVIRDIFQVRDRIVYIYPFQAFP